MVTTRTWSMAHKHARVALLAELFNLFKFHNLLLDPTELKHLFLLFFFHFQSTKALVQAKK